MHTCSDAWASISMRRSGVRSASLKSSTLLFARFCAFAHAVTSSNACICRPFLSHASSKDGLTLGTRIKSLREGMTFSCHSLFTKSAVFLLSMIVRSVRWRTCRRVPVRRVEGRSPVAGHGMNHVSSLVFSLTRPQHFQQPTHALRLLMLIYTCASVMPCAGALSLSGGPPRQATSRE